MEYVGIKTSQLENIGRVLSALLFLRLPFLSEILPLFADK
jgi:hypothetical protein